MRWSRLKQLTEQRMASSLNGRVEVHSTRYRNDRWQEDSRGWFTVDTREVASFSSYVVFLYDPELLNEFGQHPSEKEKFEDALGAWLNRPVDDLLASQNEVARALALLDARLGKRRLRTLRLRDDEHPLVWRFYVLRCEAEGITPQPAVA